MKMPYRWLAGLMIAGWLGACSPPSDASRSSETSAPAATMAPDSAPQAASATGVVQSVHQDTGTITIAHGPVPALQWPAMTMTFQVREVDLTGYKPGDHVEFEFSAKGMSATITALKHR